MHSASSLIEKVACSRCSMRLPIGPLSPLSSLLVERRDLEPTSWQSHFLEDRLFHFLMKPAVFGYSLKDAAIAKIQCSREGRVLASLSFILLVASLSTHLYEAGPFY